MFDHTHSKKVFFLVFELNSPSFNLSLVLSMHIAKKNLTLHTIPSYICTHGRDPPEPPVLQTKQLFQPLCVCQMLHPLHCALLDSSSLSASFLSCTQTPDVSPGLSRGEGSLISTYWQCCF